MNERLILLGTGTAMPSQSYNTCFVIETDCGRMLFDAGGGNSILTLLDNAGIDIAGLHHMFLSHTHTDHILGAVWVLRRVVQLSFEDRYEGHFTVFGNESVIDALRQICRLTYLNNYYDRMCEVIDFHIVSPGDTAGVIGSDVRFIDCRSENVDQTGLDITLPSGRRLCCLGDEALTPDNAAAVAGTDYLVCGAFCRYADRTIFHPYEKHHLTVKDVATTAAHAAIGTLIIVHCEDRTGPCREELYRAEAADFFAGSVIVPSDGTVLSLTR